MNSGLPDYKPSAPTTITKLGSLQKNTTATGQRKTQSEKSRDYRDVIVEKLRCQSVFRPHENETSAFSNSSGLKSVFEKLRFCEGLV